MHGLFEIKSVSMCVWDHKFSFACDSSVFVSIQVHLFHVDIYTKKNRFLRVEKRLLHGKDRKAKIQKQKTKRKEMRNKTENRPNHQLLQKKWEWNWKYIVEDGENVNVRICRNIGGRWKNRMELSDPMLKRSIWIVGRKKRSFIWDRRSLVTYTPNRNA